MRKSRYYFDGDYFSVHLKPTFIDGGYVLFVILFFYLEGWKGGRSRSIIHLSFSFPRKLSESNHISIKRPMSAIQVHLL
ncbi:MAG: hypothetical protein DRJ05_04480 [Bacteroidetes bacterium]|nr:MAG: hypothetical protein DRJ05_04480 [Bacteroidota bacterium]